jgi:rhodanese-related sulfurtransferase
MSTTQLPAVVSPAELNHRLAAGPAADLLDVRTPAEFAAVHLPGARLVPLDALDAAAYLTQRAAPERPLYVICQSGGRARQAIEKFRRAGFDHCVLLEGGTQAWFDAGFPVERGPGRVLPLMQQVQITVGFISAAGALLALTINPYFAILPLVTGCGLIFAGTTGICGLAMLLAKMPWNQSVQYAGTSCCQPATPRTP